jgi:Cdc6-like AAA superfamily ATPase
MYDSQLKSVAQMLSTFHAKDTCVALLSGPAGSGKSCIPNFLAKELLKTKKVANLVDTFSPITPGDAFISLYNKVNPTKDEPLILVFEEVDGIIMKFHGTPISDHKFLSIMIQSKKDWNMFFDRFDRKLYPYVFVIMTTNKSIEFFDDLDPSYTREGRVDHKFEITKK